jgi:hypothetical protein
MTSRDERSLQAAAIGFLRSVVILVTRRDKIKNDIRNKLHVERLNDTINKYKENWKTTHDA